jgi:lysozyme
MSISITSTAISLIKTFEGFSPVVYNCGGGYKTIGYGHRLWRGEFFEEPFSVTDAEVLLLKDLKRMAIVVHRLIRVPLSHGQEAALLSFVFNVGPASLERSTVRLKVNREEHKSVPEELMRWVWAGGKRCRGLQRRRFVEGQCYASVMQGYESGKFSCGE